MIVGVELQVESCLIVVAVDVYHAHRRVIKRDVVVVRHTSDVELDLIGSICAADAVSARMGLKLRSRSGCDDGQG